MSKAEVNEAVSAALALRALEKAGRASGIDLAMRDRMVMAEHINTLRDIAHQACATLRKARREIDATASPQHAAWAEELNAAIEGLERA